MSLLHFYVLEKCKMNRSLGSLENATETWYFLIKTFLAVSQKLTLCPSID